MDFGFLRIAAAIPSVQVAGCRHNVSRIEKLIRHAAERQAALVAFPELAVTGYTCGDLFTQRALLDGAESALADLLKSTSDCPTVCIAGMPVAAGNRLYNTAVVFCRGRVLGIVPKTYLPNYGEFYESRWFASGTDFDGDSATLCGQRIPMSTGLLFGDDALCFGIELCEDLWVPVPPSSLQAAAGAHLIVNLSASDEMAGKHAYLRSLVEQQSARAMSAYLYCSAGFGESTTDMVFAGNALVAENGTMLGESERFSFDEQLLIREVDIERLQAVRRRTNTFGLKGSAPSFRRIAVEWPRYAGSDTLLRTFDPHPFVPSDDSRRDERCREIFNIQVSGLAQRIRHTGARSAVIGISGGLDSTLALLVTVRTFDKLDIPRRRITGITMPGFGTTGRTYGNALNLMRTLGVDMREIGIKAACEQHFNDIGLDPSDRSTTYENAQARERTQILMDFANRTGGLVVGTGDLSELALGWATYNGDHMSMYGVNCGIPKTLVRYLVRWAADNGTEADARPYLLDIIDTPISPELLPAGDGDEIAQRTEDTVGPYELHDFFLYHFIRYGFSPTKLFFMACRAFDGRYDRATVKKWLITFLRRFFSQQFKRSALPDGPKVGSISLSPRGDWRMPSDATAQLWIAEAEALPV